MRYIVNLAIILSLLIPLCLPYPVQAATATLSVTGESGYISGWSSYPNGAGNYTNLNSDDDDTSYAYFNGSGGNAERAWTVTSLSGASSINSVTIYYKVKLTYHARVFVRIGGVNYYDTGTFGTSGEYILKSVTWATSPATGLAWTQSEINSTYFGYSQSYSGGVMASEGYVTYYYVVADYILAVPTVTTSATDTPTYSGSSHNCTLNGSVTNDGGTSVTERGFVYGTTSNSTNPGNIVPPATYTSNWTEGSSSFGTGSISHNIGGLVAGITYYVRAFAKNPTGYGYGDEVSFTTLTNPAITSVAATLVTSTTARLNALLTSDGNQACDVRFSYGVASHSGNCTAGGTGTACGGSAYNTTTAWVSDAYVTGNTPYVDISGLTIGTTYYFCAQAQNDVTCTCGGELSFTTSTGVNEPTSLNGIASPTSISLLWNKGTGSTNTLVRRKTGSYPSSTSDGTQVYLGTMNSYKDTGLTSGTTYYYVAWGNSGAYYSTSNTTLMVTTLASSAAGDDMPTVTTPDAWFQSPDYTNMSNFPLYSIMNFAFDAFEVPKSTGWYVAALIFAVACGILFYSAWENSNLFLSILIVGAVIVFESMLKLVPLWNILPFAIIAIAGIFVGERRG